MATKENETALCILALKKSLYKECFWKEGKKEGRQGGSQPASQPPNQNITRAPFLSPQTQNQASGGQEVQELLLCLSILAPQARGFTF